MIKVIPKERKTKIDRLTEKERKRKKEREREREREIEIERAKCTSEMASNKFCLQGIPE